MRSCIIIGCGISGITIARLLADTGKYEVTIIEKTEHIGGLCRDIYHKDILCPQFGCHYIRTDSKQAIDFLKKYTELREFEPEVMAEYKGKYYNMPINRNTINAFFSKNLKSDKSCKEFLDKLRDKKVDEESNSENKVLAKCGKELYEAFFKKYTKKAWGIYPDKLDASVCARIPIRTNTDNRYFENKYQFMPYPSYSEMFKSMLDHKNIEVQLNTELKDVNLKDYDLSIITCPIDEFYGEQFGKLDYRCISYEFITINRVERYGKYCQINYVDGSVTHTRRLEPKLVTGQKHRDTVIIYETIGNDRVKGYPIPNKKNKETYLKYKELADKEKNIYFIGRLSTYAYLGLTDCVDNAIQLFNKLKTGGK